MGVRKLLFAQPDDWRLRCKGVEVVWVLVLRSLNLLDRYFF